MLYLGVVLLLIALVTTGVGLLRGLSAGAGVSPNS